MDGRVSLKSFSLWQIGSVITSLLSLIDCTFTQTNIPQNVFDSSVCWKVLVWLSTDGLPGTTKYRKYLPQSFDVWQSCFSGIASPFCNTRGIELNFVFYRTISLKVETLYSTGSSPGDAEEAISSSRCSVVDHSVVHMSYSYQCTSLQVRYVGMLLLQDLKKRGGSTNLCFHPSCQCGCCWSTYSVHR